jgi:hypothetical protein
VFAPEAIGVRTVKLHTHQSNFKTELSEILGQKIPKGVYRVRVERLVDTWQLRIAWDVFRDGTYERHHFDIADGDRGDEGVIRGLLVTMKMSLC